MESQKKEIDRPSKFSRNWVIHDVSFHDERNFRLDIFSYKLRGVRHRSLAEKVTFNNYPEEEMPTIEVALDRRYKHTKNEAIAILTEKLAEQINKFETQWETCQNSTEKRETVQSFQGRDNPIVIAYKRSKKINFIPLFDIKWVDISWVKEDIYKSGSKYYYEIILSSKQMVKISSDEIWLATPSGQKLQKEKGIKSLWTMDEKGLSEYRQELHSAEILLSDLYNICQAYKHNQKLEHLSNIPYLIWITQKLGYSINNDFYYRNKSLNSELFKPCIPFLFCCGE